MLLLVVLHMGVGDGRGMFIQDHKTQMHIKIQLYSLTDFFQDYWIDFRLRQTSNKNKLQRHPYPKLKIRQKLHWKELFLTRAIVNFIPWIVMVSLSSYNFTVQFKNARARTGLLLILKYVPRLGIHWIDDKSQASCHFPAIRLYSGDFQ